ncbi:NAD-dependent epimerase/dehydratase family protein [Bifidobacterium sp. ESL0682]|uniref:NAD-dependent epimerase/dehydratase family protein n=1 Tax=Bifidobacterium sp. ESL0682 TaxID=2983212 RepID=UPI0023F7B41E|nr:NAD-dependent epimerase/dehydratase family protein [Bifidobacterium sp. ESL0682]WEV42679.1 NAD-dependent epimerase/dehydratase family protein [Bifidobacterium sp. ESL0682]
MGYKKIETVIPRFSRSYGPTTLATDTKASSQFIHDALNGKDIVLKSEGNQFYSYTYVADAVSGLLTVMLKGKDGDAYNVADTSSCIHLKDLAEIIAEDAGTHVVFDLPNATEQAGFSKATVACQSGLKLNQLGWSSGYTIPEGIARTLTILKESR